MAVESNEPIKERQKRKPGEALTTLLTDPAIIAELERRNLNDPTLQMYLDIMRTAVNGPVNKAINNRDIKRD
jgi:hypothetical protein